MFGFSSHERDESQEEFHMFQYLDTMFDTFRPYFARRATFHWCVIMIVGFYCCAEYEGLTSVLRWLSLRPSCYECLTHFFYATSWSLDTLMPAWITWVPTMCPVLAFHGRPLLIGDGIKVAKEGRKMPAVKALHQDSGNNSKKATIWGHHYGVVGVATGTLKKIFCTPLRAELHEGVDLWRPSEGLNGDPPTVVTRMARLLLATAHQMDCPCYAVLDAYFAVGPTFRILSECLTEDGRPLVHLITRAKKSTVAYVVPEQEDKRFRDADKVKLKALFERADAVEFHTAELTLYGKATTISYACLDLLWKPVDGLLRFMLVEHNGRRFILMSSDLTLPPLTMLELYSLRTKIEVMFDVLKNLLGGLRYHFWTRSQPKLSRKKDWIPDVAGLPDAATAHICASLTAAERFVNLALIAVGMLQTLALTIPTQIWQRYRGWLRTYSSEVPSERVVKTVIATEFMNRPRKVRRTRTFQMIRDTQRSMPVSHPPLHAKGT
jgi:hypothetical protein